MRALSGELLIKVSLEVATSAHKGQVDKAGKPYIEHPIRVSNKVQTAEEKAVALLHDVVEDTLVTFKDLEYFGIPAKCIIALRLLTRTKRNQTYMEYIKKLAPNELARRVKLADLEDNMDLTRFGDKVSLGDVNRVEHRYKPAYDYLINYKKD